jgi:hypothetical protein
MGADGQQEIAETKMLPVGNSLLELPGTAQFLTRSAEPARLTASLIGESMNCRWQVAAATRPDNQPK